MCTSMIAEKLKTTNDAKSPMAAAHEAETKALT
jgi:hypothetical protein